MRKTGNSSGETGSAKPVRPMGPWPQIGPYASGFAGAVLLVFVFFLAAGRSVFMPVAGSRLNGLAVNVGFSLLFFLQHSGLARSAVKRRLAGLAPPEHYRIFYVLTSGLALLPTVLYWFRVGPMLYQVTGPAAWALWGILAAALVTAAYSAWRLPLRLLAGGSRSSQERSPEAPPPLVTSGPYGWVRHPQHALLMVAFWATPTMTADRLLFNLLWSAWVLVGTWLEEGDLLSTYGDQYRAYQRRVPMLIPWPRKTGRS